MNEYATRDMLLTVNLGSLGMTILETASNVVVPDQ
jgi:hypothetical protein